MGGCCHYGDDILHPCIISLLLIMQHNTHQKTHNTYNSIRSGYVRVIAYSGAIFFTGRTKSGSMDNKLELYGYFRELSLGSSSCRIHLCTHLHHGSAASLTLVLGGSFFKSEGMSTMPLCLLVVVRTLTPE